MGSKIAPFRWNVGNPELWKRLGAGPAVRPPAGFHDALLRLVADVVRLWGDRADLVFVGRSLESAFDLLSGALAETDYRDRVQLLQLSLRYDTPGQLRRTRPGSSRSSGATSTSFG